MISVSNILDVARRRKLIISEIHELHKKLKRRPVKRDSSILYHMSRKYFGTWNNAMKNAGYKVKIFQNVFIPCISQDLCYFIGLLITDGHLVFKPHDYRVTISTSYIEEKEMICNLIKNLFKYIPSIRKREYDRNALTSYEICIFSKNLSKFLHEKFKIPSGAKSSIVRVPNIIFHVSRDNVYSFIRGVIDGDGSIWAEKFKISISSGSYLFLKDLRILLNKLTISSGEVVKDRSAYKLHIYNSNNNLRKLYNLIYTSKFYYPRKKSSYDKFLKNSKLIIR
jgi:intein/homing endonuclease